MVAHLIEITKITIYKNEKFEELDEDICSSLAVGCLLQLLLL